MYRSFFTFCILLAFSSSSICLGKSGVDHQTGTLLEVINYDSCDYDCAPFSFLTDSVLVCVQVSGRTIIGERKTGHNWREYYPQLSDAQGKPVSVRFDDHSIWVLTTEDKEFRFGQRYDLDMMNTPICTAEIHRHMLKDLGAVTKPASVPKDAILIPGGGSFFWHYYSWVSCSFDGPENDDICTYWDKAGRKDNESHVVSDRDGKPVPQADLQIDAETTRRNEVRLQNGVTLVSDGRARINGKLIGNEPKP